jgi:16S rRNA (cytosine1402-N4)-methyltransferase
MINKLHKPVLLEEAMEALSIKPEGCYIDGTYGRGGHTRAIMARLGAQGCVLAIDKDAEAVAHAAQGWAAEPRFIIEQGSFAELKDIAARHGMLGQVSGILLDLGVSSPQLDNPERGFSFLHDGPLDMRMDQRTGKSAAFYIANADEDTLIQVIRDYGEERFAKRIVRAIIAARIESPITTTKQLANIISHAVPKKELHKHPATRTFQALRIWVNNELGDLQAALEQSIEVLAPGGRLAVISFHSLEDRIVKQFIRSKATEEKLPKEIPVHLLQERPKTLLKSIGKAIKPTEKETKENPRARSAVLRIAEKA